MRINTQEFSLISMSDLPGYVSLIINIYSDNHQPTLKYLKDTEVNLNNILIITEDFSI